MVELLSELRLFVLFLDSCHLLLAAMLASSKEEVSETVVLVSVETTALVQQVSCHSSSHAIARKPKMICGQPAVVPQQLTGVYSAGTYTMGNPSYRHIGN